MAKKFSKGRKVMYKISSKKSIYNLIKEGTIYDEVDNMGSYLENTLGAEKMLDELYHYIDSDTIEDFISHIKRYYEIDES